MSIRAARPAARALLGVALAAGAAHAQPRQVGSFLVERKADLITDQDESTAGIVAQTRGASAGIVWHCFGDDLVVGFAAQPPGYATELRVVWRFDRDKPEGVSLPRSSASNEIYLLPDDDEHAFTTRMRSASRFVMRVLDAAGTQTDFVFDLAGSERALGSLRCVRALRPPADPPGLLGRPSEELETIPVLPPETRADTLRLIERYTPEEMRERRGEVPVRAMVMAEGRRVAWEGIGRARRPAGGRIQGEDPG